MIIGRENEKKLLEKAFHSKESEFIAVYGRRRVGKTFLIREFFEEKGCKFLHVTGIHKGTLKEQLKNFAKSLSKTFFDDTPLGEFKEWDEAFELLTKQTNRYSEKIVIFLDELPWLASRKSKLLKFLEYYWNHHWSRQKNITLIICGSSASWIIKKIIRNKGGLHNRITCQLRLLPFNLCETKQFLKSININLSNNQILNIYLAVGGVPYYLKYIDSGLTAEQNIEHLLFAKDAILEDEFNLLFKSLFENSDAYIELINCIASKRNGISRSEVMTLAKLSSGGGRLSERLKDLVQAGFIEEKTPWGKEKGEYYRLIDEFCLFYLYWVVKQKSKRLGKGRWIGQTNKQSYKAWAGYAFESICLKHIDQIVNALKMKTTYQTGSWWTKADDILDEGAQIDLLIDRDDDAITLCEIKFTENPFKIDKDYFFELKRKMRIFKEKTKTKKQLFLALISANGLTESSYSAMVVNSIVTLEDLFKN